MDLEKIYNDDRVQKSERISAGILIELVKIRTMIDEKFIKLEEEKLSVGINPKDFVAVVGSVEDKEVAFDKSDSMDIDTNDFIAIVESSEDKEEVVEKAKPVKKRPAKRTKPKKKGWYYEKSSWV